MAWVFACEADELDAEDVIRFDHAGRSFAVCMTDAGEVFCTQGYCPQDGAHLAGGLVEDRLIECPNGGCLYDLRDGQPKGGPALAPLAVHPARIIGGRVQVDLPGLPGFTLA
jgi:3-phenylpropionate/trans-cinnamate dioxygenase ferredoxin subunit